MKRNLLLIIILVFSLCGCSGKTTQPITNPSANSAVGRSYDLDELQAFFEPHHMDMLLDTGKIRDLSNEEFMDRLLTYEEIDIKFPAEIIKTAGEQCKYIIYPINHGGFYYAFLCYFQSEELGQQTPRTMEYMYLRFSGYLGSDNSDMDYYAIKPGITTLADVIKLDPAAEFVFMSGGKYTCSLLDPYTVLQVKYEMDGDNENKDLFEKLIVKEVKVMKIEDSVSLFAELAPEDR